jgi:hypothetical protein
MSIHLSMSIEDPYTEDLLLYLERKFGSNYAHKLWVLKLAQEWLQLKSPGAFIIGPASTRRPTLEIRATSAESPSLLHTPAQSLEHQPISPEVRT